MSEKKRFYANVSTFAVDVGWVMTLDSHTLRSPAGTELVFPSSDLAEAVADEWRAQGEKIDSATMPLFSLTATVVDKVSSQQPTIIRELIAYGSNDLLCYRAEDIDLASLQQRSWQPWLNWAEEEFGVNLEVTTGIMPVIQPDAKRFYDPLNQFDYWRLGVLHRVVTLGGSLVLGLGLVTGRLDAKQLFATAFLDELWQNEKWGNDYEAEDRQSIIRVEMSEAARFLKLLPALPEAN